ncbi:MAG: hypothetical protein LCH62_13010 [Proteobacteria bacterium]|nr:hypothetical protein [Pseudomonadota bacterium]
MIQAINGNRKTQTRRLASSPLARVQVGDRLWVREAFRLAYGNSYYREDLGRVPRPSDLDPKTTAVEYLADGERELGGKSYPSLHMPRWASRLTLIVEDVRFQSLLDTTETDAQAEGLFFDEPTEADKEWAAARAEETGSDPEMRGVWIIPGTDCGWGRHPRAPLWGPTAVSAFHALWNSLHTNEGERWEDNPQIVALTFRVVRENIDRIGA